MSDEHVAPLVVDLDRVASWMTGRGLGEGSITDAELLAGGTQNVLLQFCFDDRTFVLRRPPRHKRHNSDETIRREARVLAALAGTDVPHPTLIAAEPSIDVIGAAFYLMESVDGFNPALVLPEPHASDLEMQREMGLSMADALSALARVDIEERGLADLGKPDGWYERQVPRWQGQLDSYREMAGYPASSVPTLDNITSWLDEHLPGDNHMGLIHGDFHFANVLMDPHVGRVRAIVDWELATIGDPLLDLGHLLAVWPHPIGQPSAVASAPGIPSVEELVTHYGTQVDRDLSNLGWYRVLACFRLGVILEGSHARAHAGLTTHEIGDRLHEHALNLFAQAAELIDP